MTTVFLVRHARTDSNNHGRYMGWIDEDIDPDEIPAADAVARRLVDVGISGVFSSPLRRAKHTGEPLARKLNVELTCRTNFGEMRMGAWEGMSAAEIAQTYPADWRVWRDDPAALKLPGRETLDEVRDRVAAGLDELTTDSPLDSIAIFSHDVVVRLALLHVLGAPPSHYRRITADNCSVSVIRYGGGLCEVRTVNDTSHLGQLQRSP